jgi:ribosome-associated heat shock protein Hsp15
VNRAPADGSDSGRQRLDKWLWFARMARTRTGAQRLVAAGRVRINRDKTDNPSRAIRPGDVLTLSLDAGVRVLKVLACGERRGPPEAARLLYDDLSRPQPAAGIAESPPDGG